MTKYFPVVTHPFEAEACAGQQIISHSLHHSVKHCVESTYIESAPSYHIGFTPFLNKRALISFVRQQSNVILLFESLGSTETDHYLYSNDSSPVQNGEIYMTCLDTQNKKIIGIHNNNSIEREYQYYHNETSWHVIFDGSYDSRFEPAKVSINLGFKPFTNTLPEGFYPWIYDIEAYTGFKKQNLTIYCGQKMKYFTLICITLIK